VAAVEAEAVDEAAEVPEAHPVSSKAEVMIAVEFLTILFIIPSSLSVK
jgi:hypothetical protein